MPVITEASVQIQRPIDDVFQLTNEHVPQWSIVVDREEEIDDGPDEVGKRFRTYTKDHDNGKEMVFEGVITQYDPPHASAVSLTGKHFDIEAEYIFEDLQGTTQVTQRSTVKGKGLTGVIFTLFGWAMKKSSCKAAQEEMESLRRFCEKSAPMSG